MTGLDQDMIQKNRAIRTLEQSQRNMYWYGTAFVPLNFLFLLLGVLMLQYSAENGVVLPNNPDEYLPFFVSEGYFGVITCVCFVVGVVAATFSSADSSLASLTTSYCVDIAEKNDDVHYRKRVHLVFSVLLVGLIVLIEQMNSRSLIDLIYVMVSYTYGPLLGLFAFGLFTHRKAKDRFVPYIAVASPMLCAMVSVWCKYAFGYEFGYELLMLNGAITFAGLYLVRN
jgi:Na+/proline symporter